MGAQCIWPNRRGSDCFGSGVASGESISSSTSILSSLSPALITSSSSVGTTTCVGESYGSTSIVTHSKMDFVFSKKAFLVYDPQTQKVHKSQYVHFFENTKAILECVPIDGESYDSPPHVVVR